MNKVYVLLTAGLLAASCSKKDVETPQAGNDVIKIVTNVAPLTRVPDLKEDGSGNFVKDDVLSIFVAGTMNTISTTYTLGANSMSWSGLKLPGGVSEVTFSACYPKQELSNDGTFEFNTSTAEYKDLLLSEAQKVTVGSPNPVNLSFNHAMHLLNISFSSDGYYSAEELKTLVTTCKAKAACVVDAVSGKIKSTKPEVASFEKEGTTASFYLVPQPTADVTLSVKINQLTKEYSLKTLLEELKMPQETLLGGKKITLTLKLCKDKITVEGGAIGSWGDQATVDGEVVIG